MKLTANSDPQVTDELRALVRRQVLRTKDVVGVFFTKEYSDSHAHTVTGFFVVADDGIDYFDANGMCYRSHVLYTAD